MPSRGTTGSVVIETPARVLVRFSRLAAEARGPEAILPLLADIAIEHLAVRGALALQITDDGRLRAVATRGVPAAMADWSTEDAILDGSLDAELLSACGPGFDHVEVLPLVAEGDLYGALVLVASGADRLDEERLDLARGLADLAAITLARAVGFARLDRAYSELRASREALARSEKLRALGQMAAGIAHDLGNILNPLSIQIQRLRRRLGNDPGPTGEIVSRLEEAMQQGKATVDNLRLFSRQEPEAAAELTDLDRVATAATEICQPRLRECATLALHLELTAPPAVMVRSTEAVNAVVNLILNAFDAIGGPGTITVRTGVSDGGSWIEVADDGPGMPPEVERRIFEPFFTTKAHGTGLGLAMVYATLRRHGGMVNVETAAGAGTRIRLWFPHRTPSG
jgi:signal transduction histidine kinase